MVRLVRFYFLAATRAAETVIAGIGVADTDFRLEIPVSAQYPCVAVGHARTHEPALVTGIFQLAGIRTEEVDLSVDTADIVLTAVGMDSDEMSRETVAEPVAGLRLLGPVFPATRVRECPPIELPRKV